MRTRIAYALTALLLSTGVGYTVHAVDSHNATQTSVSTFNDGFLDGVCAGSPTVAQADYGTDCKAGGHN
jgi:hypothetical protein